MSNQEPHGILRGKLKELAGMIKEKSRGTAKDMEQVICRFCIQEGVKYSTAKEYLNILEGAGLVEMTVGCRKWNYIEENEGSYLF